MPSTISYHPLPILPPPQLQPEPPLLWRLLHPRPPLHHGDHLLCHPLLEQGVGWVEVGSSGSHVHWHTQPFRPERSFDDVPTSQLDGPTCPHPAGRDGRHVSAPRGLPGRGGGLHEGAGAAGPARQGRTQGALCGLGGAGRMWFPRVQLGFKCLPRRTILLASNLSRMPDSACPPMPHPSAHSPLVLTQVRARFVERFSMGPPVMGGWFG